MKKSLLCALVVLTSVPAFAAEYTKMVYETKVYEDGALTMRQLRTIEAEDPDRTGYLLDIVTQGKFEQHAGRVPTTLFAPKVDLYKGCAAQGGERETVDVEAGRFETCVSSERNDQGEFVVTWTANVPMEGFVKRITHKGNRITAKELVLLK